MSPVTVDKPYLIIAICVTTGVFVLGGQAWSATLIGGALPHWHDFAHFASFAIIALSYARALPRTSLFIIACVAVAVGCLHELYQLLTPNHDAELNDFLVNAAGAICGTFASRTLFALLQRILRPS
jgi:VanZ family protein